MSTPIKIVNVILFSLIIIYLIAGVITLYLNHHGIKELYEYASLNLTYTLFMTDYPLFYKALGISAFFSFSITSLIAFLPKAELLHGNAKFATFLEMKKKMKLFNNKGIIIGMYGRKLIRYAGKQFVSIAAGTRSGKGASVLIPNLLDHDESCVVMDVKVENFMITSKYRKYIKGQEVYLFNPFSYDTHGYNCLDYVDMDDLTNRDLRLNDIASILYPAKGDETTRFFANKAKNLFIGLCYLCNDILKSDEGLELIEEQDLILNFSLPSILNLAQNFTITYTDDDELQTISEFDEVVEYLEYLNILSSRTKEKLQGYLNTKAENTKSSIWSTFIAPLEEFFDIDVTKAATMTSDFDLRDVRKKKMTIYIGIPANHLNKCELILNIFWSQLISVNTAELPSENPKLKYECVLFMDEFAAMGYLEIMDKSISFIAGYNLRAVIIYQNDAQLEKPVTQGGYGKEGARNILSNIPCKIYFSQELNEDAKSLSETLGYKTVTQKTKNYNSGRGMLEKGTYARHITKAKRALMLPQEIREMTFKDSLIVITGEKPIKATKPFYFKEKFFINKLKSVSPYLRSIKTIPSQIQFEKAFQDGETKININKKEYL